VLLLQIQWGLAGHTGVAVLLLLLLAVVQKGPGSLVVLWAGNLLLLQVAGRAGEGWVRS
jgi:hypothetical protein